MNSSGVSNLAGGSTAFGNHTDPTKSGYAFGFMAQQGCQWEPYTGTALMGHRFYDPTQGRFVNQDPSGYSGGANQYNYVQNRVVDGMDPSGLGAVASPGSADHRIGNRCIGPGPSVGALAGLGLGIIQGIGLFIPVVGEVDAAVIVAESVDAGAEAIEGAEAAENAAEAGEAAGDDPCCFVAGTPVQMANGTTEPIEKLKIGDTVKSRDPTTGGDADEPVLRPYSHGRAGCRPASQRRRNPHLHPRATVFRRE